MSQDQPFSLEIDEVNGKFIITCNLGLSGPMGNRLKHVSNQVKGASILRRMGRDILAAGNVLYGDKNHAEGTVAS